MSGSRRKIKMTRPKPTEVEHIEVHADCVYRTSLSPALFGLGYDQTRRKILNGELPPPHRPTPTSKYQVWTGRQIIDHREKMQAIAAKKLQADRDKPPSQPPQLAAVKDRPRKKIKKTKLHPGGGKQQRRRA
jgi:hypothetical protein